MIRRAAQKEPTTKEAFSDTLARLGTAQKGAKGAPAYSRFVNRRLGRLLAAAAFHAGLTPNAVTAISAAWTFTGITLLALIEPSWALGVAVSACLVVGYAFDSADGQLARLRGGGTPAGEWLDHVIDALKTSSLHLALLIGLYRFETVQSGPALLIPIGFAVVGAVMFFTIILNDQLRRRHGVTPDPGTADQSPSILRSLVVVPTDYGLLCLLFVLLGAPRVFFMVYSLVFVANALFLAVAAVAWFREMVALGSASPSPGS